MYYINIHTRIYQIFGVFRLFGMWGTNDESNKSLEWKLMYLSVYSSFVISLILGGLFSDDRSESVYLICVGVTVSVITVKLAYILWKGKEICLYIKDIGTHSIPEFEEFVEVKNKVKKLIKYSSIFLLLIYVNCGGLTIYRLPVFSCDPRLPFDIWFPFDWTNNTLVYWIAYGFVVTANSISAISVSLNVILWYLMMNCAIKYQILGNQFRNMFLAKSQSSLQKRKISKCKENLFLKNIISLIKIHRDTQKTINRFKICFGNLFFAQIATSGMCICCSVYVLAFGDVNENLIQSMVYVTTLFYNFFDIFMVMYLGNEIKLSSDRLSYCLFESDWVERSKLCKKCIIILTEALKQPQDLAIGKVYRLDMKTFTSIVNLSYSMFNILQRLN